MRIDVILRTKNSLTNSPYFRQVVNRAFQILPIMNLIHMDCQSTDGTFQYLEKAPKVISYSTHWNRAIASQVAIEQCSTEWLMFLDDDVLLPSWWWDIARRYTLQEDVGMIWGFPKITNPHAKNRFRITELLTRKSEHELHQKNFAFRGGLHDTLIRKEAIAGIEIPEDLHIYEDWYIKKYVENQGFKAIAPSDLWCQHWLNVSYNPSVCRQLGVLAKKYKLMSTKQVLFRLALAIPKSLAILLFTGDLTATKNQLLYYFGESLSFLRG